MLRRQKPDETNITRSRAALLLAFVALLASLGGASYAAIRIPAHSIGSKQLKSGAVGARVLAVPNGAAAAAVEELGPVVATGTCVEGRKCSPPIQNRRLTLTLDAARGGLLLVEGSVTLQGELVLGAGHGTASVSGSLVVDHESIPGEWSTAVVDDRETVLPFNGSSRVGPGKHTVTLVLRGSGFDWVNVEGASGAISALLSRDVGVSGPY